MKTFPLNLLLKAPESKLSQIPFNGQGGKSASVFKGILNFSLKAFLSNSHWTQRQGFLQRIWSDEGIPFKDQQAVKEPVHGDTMYKDNVVTCNKFSLISPCLQVSTSIQGVTEESKNLTAKILTKSVKL